MLAVLSQWVKGVHDGATFSSRTGALMRMPPAFRRRTHDPRDSSIADGGVMMPSAAMVRTGGAEMIPHGGYNRRVR